MLTELARYALDLHELGLMSIIVVADDPTRIVCHPFFISFQSKLTLTD